MRKLIVINFVVAILVLFNACEDNVVITGDFYPKYMLNCVISGDTTAQYVTLLKNYMVDESGQSISNENSFIDSAFVRIWYQDTVYILRDTTVDVLDSDQNLQTVQYYYTNEFKPDYGEELEIEALLTNGIRLKSTSIVPDKVTFPLSDYTTSDPQRMLPGVYTNGINIGWSNELRNLFYYPKMRIVYYKYFNGVLKLFKKEVPIAYVESGNEIVTVYSKPSNEQAFSIDFETFEQAMANISEGDPYKTDYHLSHVELEVIIFDEFLSAYYASIGNALDEYSISLNKSDYTNIQGGYGIFGSYINQTFTLGLEEDFINQFGYLYFYSSD